jgi:hypothetical protein
MKNARTTDTAISRADGIVRMTLDDMKSPLKEEIIDYQNLTVAFNTDIRQIDISWQFKAMLDVDWTYCNFSAIV